MLFLYCINVSVDDDVMCLHFWCTDVPFPWLSDRVWYVPTNKPLRCTATLDPRSWIVTMFTFFVGTIQGLIYANQRWYIRIVRTEYNWKPNYSVLFKNRIIFVFVFGWYFQTKYIRIQFIFPNRIVFVSVRIQQILFVFSGKLKMPNIHF